jgi:hypothetical protein
LLHATWTVTLRGAPTSPWPRGPRRCPATANKPAALFGTIAARLPDGPIPGLLRDFGARDDITPEAFGWQLVQTAEGPDFQPAPPRKNV